MSLVWRTGQLTAWVVRGSGLPLLEGPAGELVARGPRRVPVACSSPEDACTLSRGVLARFRFPYWKASITVHVLGVLRHLHSGRLSPKASGLCKFVVPGPSLS